MQHASFIMTTCVYMLMWKFSQERNWGLEDKATCPRSLERDWNRFQIQLCLIRKPVPFSCTGQWSTVGKGCGEKLEWSRQSGMQVQMKGVAWNKHSFPGKSSFPSLLFPSIVFVSFLLPIPFIMYMYSRHSYTCLILTIFTSAVFFMFVFWVLFAQCLKTNHQGYLLSGMSIHSMESKPGMLWKQINLILCHRWSTLWF